MTVKSNLTGLSVFTHQHKAMKSLRHKRLMSVKELEKEKHYQETRTIKASVQNIKRKNNYYRKLVILKYDG